MMPAKPGWCAAGSAGCPIHRSPALRAWPLPRSSPACGPLPAEPLLVFTSLLEEVELACLGAEGLVRVPGGDDRAEEKAGRRTGGQPRCGQQGPSLGPAVILLLRA